jgi:hypothetical protein
LDPLCGVRAHLAGACVFGCLDGTIACGRRWWADGPQLEIADLESDCGKIEADICDIQSSLAGGELHRLIPDAVDVDAVQQLLQKVQEQHNR